MTVIEQFEQIKKGNLGLLTICVVKMLVNNTLRKTY